MSTRTVVHLVRHGEVHNPQGVLYGRMPGFHLSELGREMAVVVGEYLSTHDVTHLVSSPLQRAQETIEPLAETLHQAVTIDERVIEAGNDFEGMTVGSNPKQLLNPRLWPKLVNPTVPSWGEPYTQIASRMQAAVADARDAARGHEAVIVSHQLPVWIARLAFEGRRYWHDPRKRECSLASVTSISFADDNLLSIQYSEPAAALVARASKVPGA